MADFALWATACEGALWPEGTFWRAYAVNRDEAVDSVIEADPVGSAVCSLMATRTEWTGTASDHQGALSEEVGETVRRAKAWPATARALSGRLRRAVTFLRKVGIDIVFAKEGRARTRTIRISSLPENVAMEPSAPSAPSASSEKPAPGKGSSGAPLRTVLRPTDANDGPADRATVRKIPRDSEDADAADGADAKIASHSGGWRARI